MEVGSGRGSGRRRDASALAAFAEGKRGTIGERPSEARGCGAKRPRARGSGAGGTHLSTKRAPPTSTDLTSAIARLEAGVGARGGRVPMRPQVSREKPARADPKTGLPRTPPGMARACLSANHRNERDDAERASEYDGGASEYDARGARRTREVHSPRRSSLVARRSSLVARRSSLAPLRSSLVAPRRPSSSLVAPPPPPPSSPSPRARRLIHRTPPAAPSPRACSRPRPLACAPRRAPRASRATDTPPRAPASPPCASPSARSR